ncbi:tautomerase family protein [Sphingomonas sp. BK580]|uniref:tautomerase family protein n=1 Tax=Sphingomonas sp. BK580 TaxID=2586972 RepID=UPI0017A10E75|nr:tautomerase family protein [Sphingomonas sp. BK580]MBB3695210.1 phenylpyruvate tautomerase PptA (4-oxalocrotonate tautomerase family) [Sphingomonas sp. BK580]
MSDVVYEALLEAGALANDRFHVIAEHADNRLVFDRSYLGIQRSDCFVLVQITMNAGRELPQKKALFEAIAHGFELRAGVPREDVLINLVEVPKENWSFGNGVAQYAP